MLGVTGALGQIFIFLSIAWFGALTTSVVGTVRKVVTMCYSIVHFGHVLLPKQYLGLAITFGGLVVNLFRGNASELMLCRLCSIASAGCWTPTPEGNEDDTAALLELKPVSSPYGGGKPGLGLRRNHDSFEATLKNKGQTAREHMRDLRDNDPERYRQRVERMMSRLNISSQAEKELKELKKDPTVPFSVVEDAVFRMLTSE